MVVEGSELMRSKNCVKKNKKIIKPDIIVINPPKVVLKESFPSDVSLIGVP